MPNITANKKLVCDILAFDDNRKYLPVLNKYTVQDWEDFLTFINRNKLLPLVYSKLLRYKNELAIPSQILNTMREDYLNTSARNLTLSYDIKHFFGIMNINKIEAMLLKGSYTAEKYYDTPALRPMCDIDILIRKKDLNKILELLCNNGYVISRTGNDATQKFHMPHLITKSGNSIDFHADIYQNPFFTWRKRIDISRIWSMASKEKLYGVEVFNLPLEYNIVYLCTKIIIDNFRGKLLQLYDIALILSKSEMNWDKLYVVAAELDSLKDIFCVLYFIKKLYHVDIPENALQRFEPSDFSDTQENYIMNNLFSSNKVDGEYLAAQLAVGKNIFRKVLSALKIQNVYFLKSENPSMLKKIILIVQRLIYLFTNYNTAMKALFTPPNTEVYDFYKWLSKSCGEVDPLSRTENKKDKV